MEKSFNGDFAKLVPKNNIARRLLSTTYVYVEENKTFYFRFLDRDGTGIKSSPALDEPLESSTDYDSQLEDMGDETQDPGHFTISFNIYMIEI